VRVIVCLFAESRQRLVLLKVFSFHTSSRAALLVVRERGSFLRSVCSLLHNHRDLLFLKSSNSRGRVAFWPGCSSSPLHSVFSGVPSCHTGIFVASYSCNLPVFCWSPLPLYLFLQQSCGFPLCLWLFSLTAYCL